MPRPSQVADDPTPWLTVTTGTVPRTSWHPAMGSATGTGITRGRDPGGGYRRGVLW